MKPIKFFLAAPSAFALIASSPADVPISYSVPRDGRSSLAIYDQDGRLVRTRLTGQPRASGQHSASWDRRVGAVNEGAHWGVKTDLEGRHLWTNDRWAKDPWVQETAAVTLVGERLFELLPNGDVYGYEARTGREFTSIGHPDRLLQRCVFHAPVRPRRRQVFLPPMG